MSVGSRPPSKLLSRCKLWLLIFATLSVTLRVNGPLFGSNCAAEGTQKNQTEGVVRSDGASAVVLHGGGGRQGWDCSECPVFRYSP